MCRGGLTMNVTPFVVTFCVSWPPRDTTPPIPKYVCYSVHVRDHNLLIENYFKLYLLRFNIIIHKLQSNTYFGIRCRWNEKKKKNSCYIWSVSFTTMKKFSVEQFPTHWTMCPWSRGGTRSSMAARTCAPHAPPPRRAGVWVGSPRPRAGVVWGACVEGLGLGLGLGLVWVGECCGVCMLRG